MNKKIILVLVLAFAIANAGQLAFDLPSTKYTKAYDFWTVDVPCGGGSGSYAYSCQLPTDWRLENNRFKIPAAHASNYNQQYVCRCKVRDNTVGNVLERALSFKCTTGGFVISDFDYFYGQSSGSTGSFGSITGLDVLKRLQNLGGVFSQVSGGFGGVSGGYGGVSGGYGTVKPELPAWSDCDGLISNGNVAEILALIQKVVSSTTIKCADKVQFLNDLLGRINAALKIKQESFNQLKALIDGIVVQITKLKAEIVSLTEQKGKIDIDGLNKQLKDLYALLQAAFNKYNQCVDGVTGLQQQLATLQAELKELEECITRIQNELKDWQSKLTQIDSDISDLEIRLAKLKQQREDIRCKINDLKGDLVTKTNRWNVVKGLIADLIAKIELIKKQCAGLKADADKIQNDIKCLEDQLDKAQARFHDIDQRITQINIEIERLNGQKSEYEIKLKALKQCIENLNSVIKEITQTIKYLDYNCNDCSNVVVDDNDREGCFKFNKNDWFQYMNRCYGASQGQLQISFPAITVEIKPITIFSPVFEQNYGSCFGDQVKTRGSNWDDQKSYGFDNDFSCSANANNIAVKKGKIRAINNKYVDVDCDDGQQVRLKLGSCSRFEGQGKDFVPKTGNTIHFKGSKNVDSTFNLHSCTCY